MQRTCEACGISFEASRANARSCSSRCRVRLSRAGASSPLLTVVPDLPEEPVQVESRGTILGAVLAEVAKAHAEDLALARIAISHAKVLDEPFSKDTASARAALSRELRTILAEVNASKPAQMNPLEALRLRRQQAGHAG